MNTEHELTHFNEQGRAHMVDVGMKPITQREALAGGEILVSPEVLQKIKDGTMKKGDVLQWLKWRALWPPSGIGN